MAHATVYVSVCLSVYCTVYPNHLQVFVLRCYCVLTAILISGVKKCVCVYYYNNIMCAIEVYMCSLDP